MSKRYAVILAAGKGTRMKSNQYKVLHEVAHLPMLERVIRAVKAANFDEIYTVISPEADSVREVAEKDTNVAVQAEQLGTGHAVRQVEDQLKDKDGTTIVLYGDGPMITTDTLNELLSYHEESGKKATVMTGITVDPTGYGRIIRNADGHLERIVEEKDATADEKVIDEVNTGIYAFDNRSLFESLTKVTADNQQGEYYLPDVVTILKDAGEPSAAYVMADFREAMGVNTQSDLARANRLVYRRKAEQLMATGVTVLDPDHVWIDDDVTVGAGTTIEPNVHLIGNTTIGANCQITSGSRLTDATIADDVVIKNSTIESSTVGRNSDVGPMAHLRPNSEIHEHVHIGNFVEVKNSVIDDKTKVGHLTYIGDADLGKGINVSCGVIFSNYDGTRKHRSTIGDHSFIGANVTLISPVNVADHSFLAAGSTITDDVAARDMAIARARQVNKEDYWHKLAVSENPENE